MPIFAKPITYAVRTYQLKLCLANANNKKSVMDATGPKDTSMPSAAVEEVSKIRKYGGGETGEPKEAPNSTTTTSESTSIALGMNDKVEAPSKNVITIGKSIVKNFPKGNSAKASPGTSSGTASSKIEDEPFGLASRWTVEEPARKKVVAEGLKKDGEEGEWVVV